MKFFVNFLSAFRIAASFAIIGTMLGGKFVATFILFVLAALSDFFDGYLARKYDVCTKLGGVMDHIGDKLLVVNTLIMLCVMLPMLGIVIFPLHIILLLVVIPSIIMIARELYISGLREFLGTQKIEMPVPKARFSLGKIKTTMQMISLSAFLLWFVIVASSATTFAQYLGRAWIFMFFNLLYVGIVFLWFAFVASIASAIQYTKDFTGKLKNIR